MSDVSRRPAAFSLDDPRLVAIEPRIEAERPAPDGDTAIELAPPPSTRRRVPWGTLFWSASGGLVLMWLGWAVMSFVQDLLARVPWAGAIAMVLAVLAGLALLVIVAREIFALVRLNTIEKLRERATTVIASDDREQGRALVSDLLSMTSRMPRLARSRAQLQAHLSDIIDGRDLVRLAERDLMAPLDAEARRMVVTASKRVSVVTAVSPRAAVDMLFVLINALGLIRKLAVLYGGRPGTLGVLKLLRRVVSHLAVTGGMAVTDSLLQQVIGHGLAARLSARLGEGVLNGLLTARLGLLAIDLTRPLPFAELPRPALNDLAGTLLRSAEADGGPPSRPRASKDENRP